MYKCTINVVYIYIFISGYIWLHKTYIFKTFYKITMNIINLLIMGVLNP